MDIKEIKTEGYERVIRGCDEKSNFNSFIAIHTLKNGPAFGGIRYFNYRDNVRAVSYTHLTLPTIYSV